MGVIRLLLALTVAIGHALGGSFFPGKTAVQVFFIISGFYMSLILNEKYLKKKGSYKLFITNRFLRLFPSYWTVLVFTFVFSLIVYQLNGSTNSNAVSAFFTYHNNLNFTSFIYLIFTNLFVFFQDVICFLGLNKFSGRLYFTSDFYSSDPPVYIFLLIPQAWSISLELLYYLIAPFIVRKSIYITLTLILLSFVLRVLLVKSGLYHDPWNYRFFPTEVLFFLLGNIAYNVYLYIKPRIDKLERVLKYIFVSMVLFTISYGFIIEHFEPKYIQILYFFLFTCSLPFVFLLTQKSKIDRFVGELSYPIYISHILMMQICKSLDISRGILFTFISVILSIVFAILINKFLNNKIEKYRQRRVRLQDLKTT